MPLQFSPNREAAIWARLMQVHGVDLSPEVAESLLPIGFDDGDRDRMQQLAEWSESGTLTDKELAEFDSYLACRNELLSVRKPLADARLCNRAATVRERC
jgi:hypothetical protein